MKTKQLNKQSNASKQVIKSCKPCTDGFSLIELIVVIAIMAVLVAVLTPSLLSYVERSRAQKDFSAMDEVVNAIMLSMSDSDVYDELLDHSVKDNVSCYIDVNDEANAKSEGISTKEGSIQYIFGDDNRVADETPYYAAGNMRGVTITFAPSVDDNGATYVMANGTINKFEGNRGCELEDCPTLYNMVRDAVGDTIEQVSQTYRNSEYTIFIKMGAISGVYLADQDGVQVYGQYNGTNLPTVADDTIGKANGRKTTDGTPAPISDDLEPTPQQPEIDPSKLIPEGATYTMADGTVLQAGDPFPETVTTGDIYVIGYYEFRYNYYFQSSSWNVKEAQNGWGLHATKSSFYGIELPDIPEYINNKPVTSLVYAFFGTSQIKTAPAIPSTVVDMDCAFANSHHLEKMPDLSHCTNLKSLYFAFAHCDQLQTAGSIPSSVTNMNQTFAYCSKLTMAPDISNCNKLVDVSSMFLKCESLKTYVGAPDGTEDGDFSNYKIPSQLESLAFMFNGCESIEYAPEIPGNVKQLNSTFTDCTSLISAPVIPDSVTGMQFAFQNCSSLTEATTIPHSVSCLTGTFSDCTSLSGDIIINAKFKSLTTDTNYKNCFKGTTQRIDLAGSSTALELLAATDGFDDLSEQDNVRVKASGDDESQTPSIDNPIITFDMELSEDSDNPTEVSESAFNLSGTVAGKDGVKSLTVGGYGEEIDENGSWQTTLRLTNNQVREVVVTATDNAGQVCTKTVYVVYRVYEPFTISTSNRKDIGYDEAIASQHLVIPATFEKNGRLYKVVGFNSDAFWYKSNLASVTIPKTVTSISGDPFQGCSNLAAIYVEDGSETYCSVDGVLYTKDMTSIVLYPKGKEGTSYSIQNSVTNIGAYAFYGCKKLSTINIPNNVTNIENFAFYGCEAMQSIDLPNGLINIGEDSFRRTGLTSINIPNSVTTIGGAAFAQSYNITTITIPAKVESIGEAAFWNMNGLREIIVDDNNQWFRSINGVLFDKDVTKILFYPGNIGDDSYTIPNTVTTIAEDVFNNRSTGNKLKHLIIPASVVTIEENAFYACYFETVTFENPDGWKIDGETVDVSDPATAATLTQEHYKKVWTRDN